MKNSEYQVYLCHYFYIVAKVEMKALHLSLKGFLALIILKTRNRFLLFSFSFHYSSFFIFHASFDILITKKEFSSTLKWTPSSRPFFTLLYNFHMYIYSRLFPVNTLWCILNWNTSYDNYGIDNFILIK